MGLRFRKSINLGLGIKVNLSKSGVGYSWGVPGYRITKTAKGHTRKTYSIPGTGISYSKETSNRKSNNSTFVDSHEQVLQNKSHQKNDTETVYDANRFSAVEDIATGKLRNLQPEEYKSFLRRLSFLIFAKNITLFLFLVFLIVYLSHVSSSVYFFLGSLISLLLFILIRLFAKLKIEYEFQDETENAYREYVDVWKDLKKSYRVWQITRKAAVVDKKNMWGAKGALERNKLKMSFRLPWYLKSNLSVPVLYFKKVTLILLPDKVLVVNKIRAGAVNQKNVNMKFYNEGFIEDEVKPKDSEFITYRWLHSNESGEPDKRFQNNRELPAYRYSYIKITSPEGINEEIMTTNTKICLRLTEYYNKYMKSVNLSEINK